MQSMIHYGRLKIRRERVPSIDQVEEARENVFFEKLRATLDAGKFPKQDRMVDRLLEQGYTSTDIASALLFIMQGGSADAGKPAEERTAKVDAGVASAALDVRQDKPRPHGRAVAAALDEAAVHPSEPDSGAKPSRKPKDKFERSGRTGKEPGFATLFLNVGRKQLITPADLVGKIAGVTRLPASVVGAIDIHQRHSLVDVAEKDAAHIIVKMTGVRVKGQVLQVTMAERE